MKRPIVLACGDLLWDLLPSGAVLGGATANFAFRLNSLETTALLASRVGSDERGEHAVEFLRAAGLTTTLIQSDPRLPTGTVDVTLDARGTPAFTINQEVSYHTIEETPELLHCAAECDALYLGALIQHAPRAWATVEMLCERAPRAIKVFDCNLRTGCFSAETLARAVRRADIIKVSRDEIGAVNNLLQLNTSRVPEFCRAISARCGATTVIVTLDRDGVYARTSSGEETLQPGYVVDVVDTVGAGDSFTAGFIDARLHGADLEQACSAGNRLGALVASRKGGMCTVTAAERAAFDAPRSPCLDISLLDISGVSTHPR